MFIVQHEGHRPAETLDDLPRKLAATHQVSVAERTTGIDDEQHFVHRFHQAALMHVAVERSEQRFCFEQSDHRRQIEYLAFGFQALMQRVHEFEIRPGVDAEAMRLAVHGRTQSHIQPGEGIWSLIDDGKLMLAQLRTIGHRIGTLPRPAARHMHAFEQADPAAFVGQHADIVGLWLSAHRRDQLADRWPMYQRTVGTDQQADLGCEALRGVVQSTDHVIDLALIPEQRPAAFFGKHSQGFVVWLGDGGQYDLIHCLDFGELRHDAIEHGDIADRA